MKENQILALIKKPGQPVEVEPLFENSLKAFQDAVGGRIEAVSISHDFVVICNEEGRILDLQFNVEINGIGFVGTIVVVGVKGSEFASVKASSIPLLRIMLEG